MSINLDDVDLSQIQTSFILDVKGKSIEDCAWIEIINESDFTCTVNAGSVNVQVLAWEAYPIELQVHTPPVWQAKGASFPINITPRLLSTMVSQPYSTILTGVLYLTGEVPSSTSPRPLIRQAFIPNNVGTTTVGSTLVNEGNAPGTNVINIQPSDVSPPNSNPTITADNSGNVTVKGDNAGTLTTLLQLIAGASPAVKLAAAAVLTEALGNLQADGNLIIKGSSSLDNGSIVSDGTGNILFNNAKNIQFKNSTGSAKNVMSVDSSNDLTLSDLGGTVLIQNSGTNVLRVSNNSSGIQLGRSVNGDCIDQTATGLFLKCASGAFNYQSPDGTTQWSRTHEQKFSGSGNGSFSCPTGGYDIALPNPCKNSSSSQTIGITFTCPSGVTTGAGLSWDILTVKF